MAARFESGTRPRRLAGGAHLAGDDTNAATFADRRGRRRHDEASAASAKRQQAILDVAASRVLAKGSDGSRCKGPAVSAGLCSLPIKFRPLSLLVQRRQHLVKSHEQQPEDSGKGVAQLEDQEQCAADRESAKGEGGERGGVDPRE